MKIRKRAELLVSIFLFTLMSFITSASAEELNIGDFRNVIAGANSTNITASNLNVTKQIGWQKIDSTWYFFNELGQKQIGWLNYEGTWYYFDQSGGMQHDTTINGYKLSSSGAWIK